MSLERQTLERRSLLHRCSDRVSALATSPAFIVVHVVWFAIWIGVNALIGRSLIRTHSAC